MSPMFRQPHSAVVTHPVRARDAGTNVGSLNYASPPAESVTVKCLLQMRGGTRSVLGDGAAYPIDAIMYTTDFGVAVDDMVQPSSPDGLAGLKFVVTAVAFKSDVEGRVRHVQCSLTRSQAL